MKVLEGRFELTLDGKKVVVSARDKPVQIPRGHVHGFTCFKGERATMKERTEPSVQRQPQRSLVHCLLTLQLPG